MKKIKLLVAAALLAVGTTASAQFSNSRARSARNVSTKGWSTFYVQWNPSTIAVDVKEADDQSFTGLSVGYNKAFSIAKGIPLFLEAGVGLQYSFYTFNLEDDGDYEVAEDIDPEFKTKMLSFKIPVNLTYNWSLPGGKVDLAPFVGLNFRLNVMGKQKFELNAEDDEYNDEEYMDEWLEGYGLGTTSNANLFDKDDMGSKDYTWKRFQVGWQIGVNARFNDSFLLGVSYGTDFSELYKKAKIKTTSITLGYCF